MAVPMRPLPDFQPGLQLAAVRILLLEDDAVFAELVRAYLDRVTWGDLRVERAETLAEALSLLEKGAFDLVITDLNLPDSIGLDTVESLVRATDRLILVVTGEPDESMREAALGYGAYDLVNKDRLDRAQLERLVRLAALQAKTFRFLRKNEETFRSLTELSADWYWEQDAELRFVATGGATEGRGGITPESHIGKCRWELPHTEILGQTWEEHKAVLETREPFRDLLLRRAGANDNDTRYVSVSGTPIFEQGVFCGYRGVAKDVTEAVRRDEERKREEEVLRASEERFRSLTSLYTDWYWEQDTEFRFTRFDGRMADLESRHASEVIGRRRWEIPSITPLSGTWDEHRALLAARQPFRDFEYSRNLADGSVRYLSVSGEPVHDAQGLFRGYRGIAGDITTRKLAEQATRDSEARFRSTFELAASGMAHIGLDRKYLRVNRRLCEILGYAEHELIGLTGRAISHPADLDMINAQRPKLYAGEFDRVRIEKRYLRKDGSTVWVNLTVALVRNAAGEPEYEIAIFDDITERKAHARFQEKVARFGASALGKREAADLVEDALQNVVEALPETVVAYVEPDAGERELVLRGLVGLATGEAAKVASYGGADAVALALEHGELAIVERAAGGAALLPFEWAASFRGAALVPVHGDSRVQGALCVMSEGEHAFGAEESKFLVTVASVLSAGLRRIDSEGRLAFLAQFDALTGLPNRALLADRFSQMIVQARRHEKPLGVLFIDLDDFKLVNDSLGHAGGDELLKETARRLQSSVRAGDTVARISGDEFAVILGDLTRPDDAALVAQKIIDRLATPLQLQDQEVFVTASIGIAAFPADGADAEALLGAADAAMYRAKQSGRNSYQFFTAEINQRTRVRAQLGSELRRALERDEFALVYQPKFDLRSGRPCAAEALLRWRHPERGLVSPVEFIPVLEETGLIVQVGEWVLRRACADLKAWQAAGMQPLPVAVNLSARQFRQQDLDVQIRDLVSAAGVEPSLIELEITESQLMQDPDHAKRVIHALSDSGFGVAIDDFGTGYSSLSYLTRFPVTALKIDRSFVANVLTDRAAAAIVRTIIDMAHTLGFIVIAEGVETEAQALLLRGLGCEQAQGYYFARPMPEADFRALIASFKSESTRHQVGGKR